MTRGRWSLAVGLATLVTASLASFVGPSRAAQEPDLRPQMELRRDDQTIRVVQNADSAAGAEFVPRNPRCEEGVQLGVAYAPAPGFVETFVNAARITSTVALLRRPAEGAEGEELELFGGALRLDDANLCPVDVERLEDQAVTITEGRTRIDGVAFLYDNAAGVGRMSGPVRLERSAEGESPGLVASSEGMEMDVDSDRTILTGGVRVESEDRVSEAERLEYDEARGWAVMTGSPARTTRGSDVVEGRVIEYDLDTNDVVVRQGVRAEFEYERNGP